MRALCEAPQMMLHYADIPYEYKMVWDHYGSSWAEVKKDIISVSYTHLRAHETSLHLVCRLLLEKKKKNRF